MIKTDHQSLKYLLEQKIGTPTQQKWITKLFGYAFLVEYKHGKENLVADAFSRREAVEDGLLRVLWWEPFALFLSLLPLCWMNSR